MGPREEVADIGSAHKIIVPRLSAGQSSLPRCHTQTTGADSELCRGLGERQKLVRVVSVVSRHRSTTDLRANLLPD